MRIAVVGSSRTRSTLLTYYLQSTYPNLKRYDELYTREFANGNLDLPAITHELLKDNNFIVKIMGYNLLPPYNPEVFDFRSYDQVHLIERYDFFEQCCSLQVSYDTDIWLVKASDINPRLKQQMMITNRQYTLTAKTIIELAKDTINYMTIKSHLIENHINFTMHTYDQAAKYGNFQTKLVDNRLDYQSLITNYHLKDKINLLFNQYFSYSTGISDLDCFTQELKKLQLDSEKLHH